MTRHISIFVSFLLLISLVFTPISNVAVFAETEDTTLTPETLIDTGTAAAASEAYTVDNINEITEIEDEQPEMESELASSSEDVVPLDMGTSTSSTTEDDNSTSTVPVFEVDIENESSASTSATTTALSGSNTATGSGTTAIITGDAYAYSNVVNLTNTNIINSIGFIVFLNQLFGSSGVDIRDLFDVFSGDHTNDPCSNSGCEARQLDYYADNQSSITNTVTVSANTGDNTATGSGTTAIITGDAYAAANVTNIANTNIIDANYMMLTFSNFGDLLGDIVLPSKSLLEKLFKNLSNASASNNISTNNQANVENSVLVGANSGDNTASGTDSSILTGNATTYSNVYNQTNTNVINSDSITLLFRVSGDWDGEVYGLPDGLHWERTGAGIYISNDPNFTETAASTQSISADINNEATIINNISVSANTGSNQSSGSEQSYIDTGDAYAAANVTNIANTNILGRNWALLIFDIFGSWQGNISFGKPDLWIGGTANATNGKTGAGQEIVYTFTVSNLGDAEATNVKLDGSFNSDLMSFLEPMEDINLGTLSPGETVEKTIRARVVSSLDNNSHPVDLTAKLSGFEPEENIENNTEVVTVVVENVQRSGGSSGNKGSSKRPAGNLVVTKSSNKDVINPGERVSYEINIKNTGGPIYGATLYDTLFNPNDEIISTEQWYLETIDPDENIIITYETEYSTSSPGGTYLNRAQVLGYHKNRVVRYMENYDSPIASRPLTIIGAEAQVLGLATTTESCEPYLKSFLKFGSQNDEREVERLQTYLHDFSALDISVSGVFDTTTEKAVKSFQQDYASDVLEPWGLSAPTGHVYYTTKKKINELYCNEMKQFPLSSTQLDEINNYRLAIKPKPVVLAATKKNVVLVPIASPENSEIISEITLPKKEYDSVERLTPSNETIMKPASFLQKIFDWFKNPTLASLSF